VKAGQAVRRPLLPWQRQ